MMSLKTIPSRREVRDVADAVAQIERHPVRSTVARRSRSEEEMRQLLCDARERLEVVERVLAALRVARAEAGRDELLDERRLPSGRGEERAQMPRVDAEPREAGARGGDVGLALAVQALAGLGARDDEPVLLELARTRSGETEARSQSSASSISSSRPGDPDRSAPCSVGRTHRARRAPRG